MRDSLYVGGPSVVTGGSVLLKLVVTQLSSMDAGLHDSAGKDKGLDKSRPCWCN